MRSFILVISLILTGEAGAQQCSQCTAADACIRDYTRAVSKLKVDYRKGVAEQRKGREQSLREHFAPPVTLANEGSIGPAVQLEVDRLKDCLAKIQ